VSIAAVLTHRRPAESGPAVRTLLAAAREAGVTIAMSARELEKHGLAAGDGLIEAEPGESGAELCFALGGDGTMLSAMREFAGRPVPVFGVNFGEIGFLATVERDDVEAGFRRAFARDFEVVSLPGIAVSAGGESFLAMNDVSVHRQPGNRVADLVYSVSAEEVGRVRCDGLVVATPVGSTGYNLANGGPVMAWGVEGIAVSFIAPHSLTARSLVVAPDDVLSVGNRSREEPVDVAVDGRPVLVLRAGDSFEMTFSDSQGSLAQLPGTTFYHRLREKFGRLTTTPQ
jgi:NAD+ kinase